MRRIGVLTPGRDDPEQRARIDALLQVLEPLGWTVGRNLQIDARWAQGDVNLLRKHAAELVAAAPDVILASTNQPLVPLRQATRVVPIVFVLAIDPVGAGDVTSWRAQAAMPQDFCCTNTVLVENGSNCLNRSRPE